MNSMPDIYVIIATAFYRNEVLLNRALKSVYNQAEINKSKIKVIIVDDNIESQIFDIKEGVAKLRKEKQLNENDMETIVIPNQRTRFNSGTGAWNTGIFYVANFKGWEYSFIAILDDDDEWLPNHIKDCCEVCDHTVFAVFQSLVWINEDKTEIRFILSHEDLKPVMFFEGNPGVQGSNMFISTKKLIDIQGFDENLPNTTDRDLMIRFLMHIERSENNIRSKVKVINSIGVKHYNHLSEKVNSNYKLKQVGLDLFYRKHRNSFTEEQYQKSLHRSKSLFGYKPEE